MTARTSTYAVHGTCAFRLMPNDPLVEGSSSATLTTIGDQGFTLAYTWVHPTDGEQQGALLVGGTAEDGSVEAALFDTWHQQPGLMTLRGTRDGDHVGVGGTYLEEWGWTVDIDLAGHQVSMTMRNVVPESALSMVPPGSPPMSAGPYDVMVASWKARTR